MPNYIQIFFILVSILFLSPISFAGDKNFNQQQFTNHHYLEINTDNAIRNIAVQYHDFIRFTLRTERIKYKKIHIINNVIFAHFNEVTAFLKAEEKLSPVFKSLEKSTDQQHTLLIKIPRAVQIEATELGIKATIANIKQHITKLCGKQPVILQAPLSKRFLLQTCVLKEEIKRQMRATSLVQFHEVIASEASPRSKDIEFSIEYFKNIASNNSRILRKTFIRRYDIRDIKLHLTDAGHPELLIKFDPLRKPDFETSNKEIAILYGEKIVAIGQWKTKNQRNILSVSGGLSLEKAKALEQLLLSGSAFWCPVIKINNWTLE